MEKRRDKRSSLTGIATVQLKDGGDNKSIQGLLGSISSVGMGLYVDKPIEANKQVSVAISFLSIGGVMKDSVVEGSVVYSKDLGENHFVGIRFNEIADSKNQPLLYQHIQNILLFE
jgi:hypothetical protein